MATDAAESGPGSKERRIRDQALDALRRGRVEETEALLRSENISVVQLTQELLVYQAELEIQAEELWEANQRLGLARERFRRFFQSLPQPALILDPHSGEILETNDLARLIFRVEGPSSASLSQFRRLGRGRKAQDLLAGAIADATGRGRTRLAEVALGTRSGTVMRCRIDFEQVKDDVRKAPVLLAVIADETENRARMDELAREGRLAGAISSLMSLAGDPALTLEDVLSEAPDILASGLGPVGEWSVRIDYEGREFFNASWKPAQAGCRLPILINEDTAGWVAFGRAPDAGPDHEEDAASSGLSLPMPDSVHSAFAELLARIIENRRLSQQLTQTERLAAIGQVAGGIAHDFNNLLTVIIGAAEELAAPDGVAEGKRQVAEGILSASLKAAQLTSYLLAYARRQPLEPRQVSPRLLLAKIQPAIDRAVKENIDLQVGLEPNLPSINVDPGQLENAILNLVSNAQDALPGGGHIVIHVSSAPAMPPDLPGNFQVLAPSVVVEVRDDGSGMAPDVLALCLEPFFTTKQRGRASGLGLSMVSGFVEQSGGHLDIRSVPGEGTRVRMYFPARSGQVP
jgi:signal transduction histidine kinase/PAS domain-containing protein